MGLLHRVEGPSGVPPQGRRATSLRAPCWALCTGRRVPPMGLCIGSKPGNLDTSRSPYHIFL
jgi:hypothetical protein